MDHIKDQYEREYRAELDSDFTLECAVCGALNLGDEPRISIVCLDCYRDKAEWSVEFHEEDGGWLVVSPDGEPVHGEVYPSEEEAQNSIVTHMAQRLENGEGSE